MIAIVSRLGCDYPIRVIDLEYPLQSLQQSRWFKLICGASFQHLPAVRSLTLAYALAGADCIDVAADPAVVAAARDGIRTMQALTNYSDDRQPSSRVRGTSSNDSPSPWLMVSLNDGDDPHFRKAAFDPDTCPPDCDRPCEQICPAQAIIFKPDQRDPQFRKGHYGPVASGVVEERCYGCGRCVPICPVEHINTRSYLVPFDAIAAALVPNVDAIEIHTQVGRIDGFLTLWQQLRPHLHHLKLLAISCPDGDRMVEYLQSLHAIVTDDGKTPLPCHLLWQTDGRPMSGDIGKGTTHAAVRLAQKVIAADLPGFVQLAGGTNAHTVPTLRSLGLLSHPPLAGVAYGSYARKVLAPVLEALDHRQTQSVHMPLEAVPDLLSEAVRMAHSLVSQIKQPLVT